MLCNDKGYSSAQDISWPTNADIVRAFSPSDDSKLHCIINSVDRELFIVAPSCRDAKIIAIFHGHLQELGCGRCSQAELQKYTEVSSEDFWEKVQTTIQSREPGTLWSAGYWSSEQKRLARIRLDQILMGVPT